MNNSSLRNYFGQNYGRKEDDMEARANAAKPMVEYKGQPIFKHQYEALAAVANQYAKKPEELTNVVLESGLVRRLILRLMPIKTSDGTLTIPKELNSLQVLNCYINDLESFILPKELNSLQQLDCSHNPLKSLVLHKELISLQYLDCSFTDLRSLALPEEHKALKVVCCGGNPFLPRAVLFELRSRGVIVFG